MNDKKYYICTAAAVAVLITSIFLLGNAIRREAGKTLALSDKQELVVAIDKDMPGVFETGGDGLSGYPCDILNAYADALGVPLRVVETSSATVSRGMLSSGKADMAAGISQHLEVAPGSVQFYTTTFSVLANREASAGFGQVRGASVYGGLRGKRVLISQGFKLSGEYDIFLDSLRGTDIFVSSSPVEAIVKAVAKGDYDFYVCETSEARLGASLDRNVRYVYGFDGLVGVSVKFNECVLGLGDDFARWLSEFRRSNEYATLTYLYFVRGAASQIAGTHNGHVISPYDHVMREVSEREGADWRMMAAIAYSESRFKPDVVSNKGAKGLMQIMPAVARQFGVADDEVMNPEVNITLAIKLLDRIESMMKIPSSVAYYDRMALVLASYNCGVGHVADARRLATKYGMNPNKWEDVSYFLKRKAEPEYYTDDVVRNGRFGGSGQTLAFVSNVLGRYNSYCTLSAK